MESSSAAFFLRFYHHQGSLPNNFMQTMPAAEQAFRAINTFKDEYLLDYINVEELGVRDKQDYAKPMGVATYKTSKDMSDELLQCGKLLFRFLLFFELYKILSTLKVNNSNACLSELFEFVKKKERKR